jgi:hypothetical protein
MKTFQDSKLLELINSEVRERQMVDSIVFVLFLPIIFIEWAADMCSKVPPVILLAMSEAATANERRYLCEVVNSQKTVRRFHLWKLRYRLRMIEMRKQDRTARRKLLATCCK